MTDTPSTAPLSPTPHAATRAHLLAGAFIAAVALAPLSGCGDEGAPVAHEQPSVDAQSNLAQVSDTTIDEQPPSDVALTEMRIASDTAQSELDAAVADIEGAGAHISYIALDLATGQAIEHDADRTYYSASTIKGPFCISLVRAQGDTARANYGGLITSTVVNSDNEAYRTLREKLYGASFFADLCAEAGVPCDLTHWYADYSVRDLANLWRICAQWLSSDDANAQWLADLMGNSLNSQVDDIAGEGATTWSKAGWYSGGGPRYDVTFDGGVVNAEQGSYAIAVATNRGSDFATVERVMRPLAVLAEAGLDATRAQ